MMIFRVLSDIRRCHVFILINYLAMVVRANMGFLVIAGLVNNICRVC